jgi:hypothetical protein
MCLETRGPSLSQQAGAGVILEDLGVADVAPRRVHAPVPRLVGHLEYRRTPCRGAGQEPDRSE